MRSAAQRGARFQFTGLGSLMSAHATDRPIRTPADAARADAGVKALFFFDMLDRGIYLAGRASSPCRWRSATPRAIISSAAVESFLETRRDLVVTS